MTDAATDHTAQTDRHTGQPPDDDGYDGPVLLVPTRSDPAADAAPIQASARLRGVFSPLDGHYHWYGRLAADHALDAALSGAVVRVDTPVGSAEGKLSDIDPWGRLRIAGAGRPPFPIIEP